MKNHNIIQLYPELSEDITPRLLTLKSIYLRDLGWYLSCQPLFFEGINIATPLSENDWIYREWDWFEEQDKNPSWISDYIKCHQKNARLGFYAENLLLYWFENHPHFKLIEQGQQITRNGKTVTEIDFFFQDLITGNYFFWESTLKFYLWDQHNKQWIGPGGKDKARLKLKKVDALQIPEGIKFIKSKHSFDFEPQLFIKGRLFSPFHSTFKWFHLSDFLDMYYLSHSEFLILPKQDWMFMNTIHSKPTVKFELFKHQLLKEMRAKNKALVYINSKKGEEYLIFVVNNNWPEYRE